PRNGRERRAVGYEVHVGVVDLSEPADRGAVQLGNPRLEGLLVQRPGRDVHLVESAEDVRVEQLHPPNLVGLELLEGRCHARSGLRTTLRGHSLTSTESIEARYIKILPRIMDVHPYCEDTSIFLTSILKQHAPNVHSGRTRPVDPGRAECRCSAQPPGDRA